MGPKYGVIGCGYISQFYTEYFQENGAKVLRMIDIDLDRAQAAAQQLGATAGTDYQDVINDPDINVVVILAHARFHHEVCMAAIRAGKHVICEKTLANSAQEACEIALAAEEAGVFFFTAYMKRFFPAVEKAKQLIPKLGTLYSASARSYQNWGNLFELRDDFSDQLWMNNYGGGVLKCAGSHILDLVLHLVGRPTSLYAHIDYVPGFKLDRKAIAVLEYPCELTVNFQAVGHCLSHIGYQRNGWDERLEINGTQGRLDLYTPTWNKSKECAALLVRYDEETQHATEYRFDAVDTFHAQMAYFDQCLRTQTPGHPNAADGAAVDKLIAAMAESSTCNKPVEIDWETLQLSTSQPSLVSCMPHTEDVR